MVNVGLVTSALLPKPATTTFDEQRFAAPKSPLRAKTDPTPISFCNLPPDRVRFSWAVGNERSHAAKADSSELRVEKGNRYA